MPPYKSFTLLSVVEENITKWALIFNCNTFVRIKSLLAEKHLSLENFELCDGCSGVCGIMRLSEIQPPTPIFIYFKLEDSEHCKENPLRKLFQMEMVKCKNEFFHIRYRQLMLLTMLFLTLPLN